MVDMVEIQIMVEGKWQVCGANLDSNHHHSEREDTQIIALFDANIYKDQNELFHRENSRRACENFWNPA
jgi:hypothetical protein